MTEKERLLKALRGEVVDRRPVICPGGMMTMACREVMVKTGCRWPDVHWDAEKMATLSLAMRDETGMENLGIPFCMTVEAEALGGEVEDGDEVTEPGIVSYPLRHVSEWKRLKALNPHKDGRLPTILACTGILSKSAKGTAVVGNLVGPLSLATSLIEATALYKALRQTPQEVHKFLGFLTGNSIRYAEALINSGADLISIADPSATGEILGPKNFETFARPYLNEMTRHIHRLERPVIVHICGNIHAIAGSIKGLAAECISFDAPVDIKMMRNTLAGKKLMGNVCTRLLLSGHSSAIRGVSANILNVGIDILAPACGVSAKTPVKHIKAMAEAAKGYTC
ncbi:MAG: methylcobamide--CoM methyltransferase [Planctomycetes bacterium]|nr:methylcobamide--CoM methyltransferase [Planctomycetota bacterium]